MKFSWIFRLFIFIPLLVEARFVAAHETCRSIFKIEVAAARPFQNLANAFDRIRFTRTVDDALAETITDETVRALKKNEVLLVEPLGGGQTDSYKVTLAGGLTAVYKPLNNKRPNMIHREVAAFKISRLMKLDIVPPTVVRKINGVEGSFQLFIESARPLEKNHIDSRYVVFRNGQVFPVEGFLSGRRLRIFDWLINNHDRGTNAGNYLVSNIDGHIMGIDHSTAFVGHDKSARKDKVPFYTPDFLRDPQFYEQLTRPSREDIAGAMSHLNTIRIPEFFERYDALLRDFERVLTPPQ